MTDQERPDEQKIPEATVRDARPEHGNNAGNMDPDEENFETAGGFDPEQRRFLWTITAVLLLGVFAATWWNISSGERGRVKMIKIGVLSEDHSRALAYLAHRRDIDLNGAIQAILRHDRDVMEATRNDLADAYKKEREAFFALRREEDMDAPPVMPDQINAYAAAMLNQAEERANQMSQQYGAAATQPGQITPATQPTSIMRVPGQ